MNNIKLTILMPSYNKEEYIKEAIESVLNQKTNFDFKLVVADDCSTDKTIEIVKDYVEKYPDKIVLLPSKQNQGLLSNIIKAYEYLIENPSPYFCCLDADDFLTDMDFYQKAIDFLDKNNDFNIYAANTSILYKDGTKVIQNLNVKESYVDSTFDDILLNDRAVLGNTISSVFRNCVINKIVIEELKQHIGDHYSEHSVREDDFRNRVHLEGSKAHFANEVVGIYRVTQSGLYQGSNSLKKVLLKIQAYIDMYYFFNKKYPQFMNLALKHFCRINNEVLNSDMNNILKYSIEDIKELCLIVKILAEYDKDYINKIIFEANKKKNKEGINLTALFQNIFSIKNEYKDGIKTHKIISIAGIKIKIKCPKYTNKNFPVELTDEEKIFLINNTKNCKSYLEYGSGGSTFLILLKTQIANITSVESDKNWIKYLRNWEIIKNSEKEQRLNFISVDIGKTGCWGTPIEIEEKMHLFPSYSKAPFINKNKFDLIFIDGRYRVACALQAILNCAPDTKIIMHDFTIRPEYKCVLEFLDVVESVDTMVLFKIKKNYDKEKFMKLYEKYKYISD